MKNRFQKTTAILLALSLVTGVFGNLPVLAQTTGTTATTDYNKNYAMVLTGAGIKNKDGNYKVYATSQRKDGTYNYAFEAYWGIHSRYGHTATKLQDGRVLITGGTNGFYAIAGAVSYDPKTGDTKFVSDMRYPRVWHTATLLPDGNVLILGGQTWKPNWNDYNAPLETLIKWFYQLTNRWEPQTEGGDPLNNGEVFLAKKNKFVTLREYFRLNDVFGYSQSSGDEPTMLSWRSGHTATYLPITNQILIVGGGLPDPKYNPPEGDDRTGGLAQKDVPTAELDLYLNQPYLRSETSLYATLTVSLEDDNYPIDPFNSADVSVRILGSARFSFVDSKELTFNADMTEVSFTLRPQTNPNKRKFKISGYGIEDTDMTAVAIEATAQYQKAEFSKVIYVKQVEPDEQADKTTTSSSNKTSTSQTQSAEIKEKAGIGAKQEPVEKIFSFYKPNTNLGGELLDLNTGKFVPLQEKIPNSSGHSALALNDGKVLLAGGDFTTATIYDSTSHIFSPISPLTIFNTDIALLPITDSSRRTTKVILFGGTRKNDGPFDVVTQKLFYNKKNGWKDPNNIKAKLRHNGFAEFDVFDITTQTITHTSPPKYIGKTAEEVSELKITNFMQVFTQKVRQALDWLELRTGMLEGANVRSAALIKDNQFFIGASGGSSIYDANANTIEVLNNASHLIPVFRVKKESALFEHYVPEWRIAKGSVKVYPYTQATSIGNGKVLITGGRVQPMKYPTAVTHSFHGLEFTEAKVRELKRITDSMATVTDNLKFFAGTPPFLGTLYFAAFLGPTLIAKSLLMIAGFNIAWDRLLEDDYPPTGWFKSVASRNAWVFEPSPIPISQNTSTGIQPLPPAPDGQTNTNTEKRTSTVCRQTMAGGQSTLGIISTSICRTTKDGAKYYYWQYSWDTNRDETFDIFKKVPFAGTAEQGESLLLNR